MRQNKRTKPTRKMRGGTEQRLETRLELAATRPGALHEVRSTGTKAARRIYRAHRFAKFPRQRILALRNRTRRETVKEYQKKLLAGVFYG